LKRIMKKERWRPSMVAAELGITRQAFHSYLINGISSLSIIERIAKIINVDPREIIK
jgi:hypothetical protein